MSSTLNRPGSPTSVLIARGLVGAIALGVFAYLANVYVTERNQTPQVACEQALKAGLGDPDSYRPIDGSWRSLTVRRTLVQTWGYRARNGFGGYVIQEAACINSPSNPDDKWSDVKVFPAKELGLGDG